jgi:hypothetical protein
MALRIPVTDDDFRSLTSFDVQEIIVAIDIAEENGDFATAESYYGILNSIIQNTSILTDRDNILSLISNWITAGNKSIPPQYSALTTFRNNAFGDSNGGSEGFIGNQTSTAWLTECFTGTERYPLPIVLSFSNIREEFVLERNDTVINEEFSFLKDPGVRRCRLVADLNYCCYNNREKSITGTIYRGIILAESKLSYWYEDSGTVDPQTGLASCRRPVYQYWYDANDIQGYENWKTLDGSGRVIPLSGTIAGFEIISLIRNSMLSSGKQIAWANENEWCKAVVYGAPNIDTFYNPGSWFNSVLKTKGFKIYEDVSLYSGLPGHVQRLSKVGRQDRPQIDYVYSLDSNQGVTERIPYAYPSQCFGKAESICGGGEGITDCIETDFPTVERRAKEDINGNTVYFEEYVTETDFTVVNGYPCYEGRLRRRIKYIAKERKVLVTKECPGQQPTRYEKWVDDNFTPEITEADLIELDYVDVRRAFTNEGLPKFVGCNGVEVIEDEEPYVDPADPCGCYEIYASKVFLKYPDYRSPSNPALKIEGPKIPSKQDFSGIGAGLKITKKNKAAHCIDEPIRVYNGLIDTRDVLSGRETRIIRGLFNTSQSLDCYVTNSLQSTKSKEYYYEITDCDDCDRTAYFGVAYGNVNGSGSIWSGYEQQDTPSKAIYSQNRLLTLDPPEKQFKFYTNGVVTSSNDIYVLHFNRNSIVNKLDPGNFEISLAELTGKLFGNSNYTGSNVQVSSSNKVLTFIDNSGDANEELSCSMPTEISYHLVSGSLDNGIHTSGTGSIETNVGFTSYGIVYPNMGLVVFDATKLNEHLSFNTVTGSNINGDNAYKLFTSISGAAEINHKIKARNVEHKTTNHYFIRVGAAMANYSNNPTFTYDNTSASTTGMIKNECFKHDPVTYITTVGLYNNNRDLLAIAKLSKPLKKTPDTDLLIKIRLNW